MTFSAPMGAFPCDLVEHVEELTKGLVICSVDPETPVSINNRTADEEEVAPLELVVVTRAALRSRTTWETLASKQGPPSIAEFHQQAEHCSGPYELRSSLD